MRNLFFRVLILALAGGAVTNAQTREPSGPWQNYDTSNGEWRSYAGDIKGTKYSPLDQIDAGNFEDLKIAWEWTSVDNFVSRSTAGGGEWWAPLDTIVEAVVEDTPDLHRPGHLPFSSRLQATPHDRRSALFQYTAVAGGCRRCHHGGDPLGVQPEGLRRGDPTDEQSVDATRGRVLD